MTDLNKPYKHDPLKFYTLFVSLYITAMLTTVILAYRLIDLNGITLPGGIFVFPFTFLFSDIIAEIYGYNYARQIMWCGVICEFALASCVYFVIHLPTPPYWHEGAVYNNVMSHYILFVLGDSASIIAGQFINIYCVSKWRVLSRGRYFWLRSLGSSALGELEVSVVSLLIAFYSIMTFSNLVHLIICSYSVKMAISLFATWPIVIIVNFLKKNRATEEIFEKISLNPFKY
jgi:queuosine precursor transporter